MDEYWEPAANYRGKNQTNKTWVCFVIAINKQSTWLVWTSLLLFPSCKIVEMQGKWKAQRPTTTTTKQRNRVLGKFTKLCHSSSKCKRFYCLVRKVAPHWSQLETFLRTEWKIRLLKGSQWGRIFNSFISLPHTFLRAGEYRVSSKAGEKFLPLYESVFI